MCRMSGTLLADEMGLGKTVTAATVAACAFQELETNSVIIVTPATLKGNWEDEMDEKSSFTTEVVPSGISAPKRSAIIAESKAELLIVNYEQVVAHVDELNARNPGIIIYDEA